MFKEEGEESSPNKWLNLIWGCNPTHTHTHTHTCTHTHTHTCTHTHTHACPHACTHTHTHTYMHARTHTHTHTHVLTLTHVESIKCTCSSSQGLRCQSGFEKNAFHCLLVMYWLSSLLLFIKYRLWKTGVFFWCVCLFVFGGGFPLLRLDQAF